MRLLVLGGTKFLGRAIVDAALAAGHEVSIFDARFGHAIQSPSRSSSVRCRLRNRRSSSERLVVKKTTTPTPGFAPSLRDSGVAE